MTNTRSLFITIEGIEGAGKSTNAKLVVDYLNTLGHKVIHTREPGGTVIAEKIRSILLEKNPTESLTDQAELLLLCAARSQHLEHVIVPALQSNHTVVCERFSDATHAYQGGGRGIATKYILMLEQLVQKSVEPDLVLLFDVDVTVGLARIKTRPVIDRIEQEKIDFFNKVRSTYLAIAKRDPKKHVIIDASKDLGVIQQQIIDALTKLLYAHN